MSKRLEDFIHDNRDGFDELEPRAALWDNIESRLTFTEEEAPKKREAKTFSLGFVLRVAAMIIMVMGVGFVFYLKSGKTGGVNLAAINPEYAKQQVHYASLVKEKRTELNLLAKSDPQLYKEFSGEIAKMDSTYKKLTSELKTSPNQERVLRAMIRNLQIQTEVLNQQLQVIEQYNEVKNQDENKNI
jgi:hypothetical protein